MDPFAALADPVRRGLLRAIAARPARVVDLAAAHPISRPAISKHQRLLTEAGLHKAAADPVDVGALARYDRPMPSVADYDVLLSSPCAGTA